MAIAIDVKHVPSANIETKSKSPADYPLHRISWRLMTLFASRVRINCVVYFPRRQGQNCVTYERVNGLGIELESLPYWELTRRA